MNINIKEKVWGWKQRFFIGLADRKCTLNGILLEQGYVKLEQFFSTVDLKQVQPIVTALSIKEEENRNKLVHRINNSLELAPVLIKVLDSGIVQEIVFNYLGKNARFDSCSSWRASSFSDNNHGSGLWHHDSVGHRIKGFLFLNDTREVNAPYTLFCPGSHLIKHKGFEYEKTRFSEEYILEHFKIQKLNGGPGDLVLFDTNALHRGGYTKNETHRDIVQFEFSSQFKSDFISGDIGPRNTFFPTSLSNSIHENPLIDKNLLKLADNGYAYGRDIS